MPTANAVRSTQMFEYKLVPFGRLSYMHVSRVRTYSNSQITDFDGGNKDLRIEYVNLVLSALKLQTRSDYISTDCTISTQYATNFLNSSKGFSRGTVIQV
jgi:hypothetical protein